MFIKKEWQIVSFHVGDVLQKIILFIVRGSEAETVRTALLEHNQSQRRQYQEIRSQKKRVWKKWKRGRLKKFIAAQNEAESAIVRPSDFIKYDGDIVEKLGPANLVKYIVIKEYVDSRVHDKR